jgi:hypothetical protein
MYLSPVYHAITEILINLPNDEQTNNLQYKLRRLVHISYNSTPDVKNDCDWKSACKLLEQHYSDIPEDTTQVILDTVHKFNSKWKTELAFNN